MSDFGKMRRHLGRKDHRCEWCGQSIPKGEMFQHFVGKWDNEFQNWRMHDECYNAASQDDDLIDGFCPYGNERPKMETA